MRRTLFALSIVALAMPLAAQSVTIRSSGSGNGNVTRTMTLASTQGGDRAMIGVSTASGSTRDTLGVLISSITAGGPAEKAGLGEGDRIQSINGASLRVARDDAGDDEMGGIMQRRLTRELGKVKAGDEVTLQVWHEGAAKAFKVKTVAADDLRPAAAMAELKREDRPVIGIAFGLTGSKRDTAGVFVNSVTENGPAEKAGIVEGDRIAAINGVSLKLSKDDLDDSWVASSRLNRMSREVAKGKPGDVVELTVVSAGRARAVKVTLGKASALKGSGDGAFTFFRSPDGPMAAMAPMPPMAPMAGMHMKVPMPPTAPAAPHAPMIRLRTFDGDETEVHVQLDEMRAELEHALRTELPKARLEMQRGLEQAREAMARSRHEMLTARATTLRPRTVRM